MRTMTAMLVILLSLAAPVLAEDTKSPSKDRDIVENREPIFGEAMGLLAVLSLWEGRYLDACVHFTLAIVHGRSKYRERLSGVKIVMLPGEIEECRDRAREHLLHRDLQAKLFED